MITYAEQLDFAKLLGESLLYGADCVLMLAVVYIQLTSRHLLPSHKIFLLIADAMFVLTSAHMSLLLYECFSGTVPPRILQSAVAVSQLELLLGDIVLIWRVWVVWNRDIRVIFLPTLSSLAGFGVGLMYAAEAVSYNALTRLLPMPTVILTAVNTTACTALIAGRLAYLDHLINGHLAFGSGRDHSYTGAILVVVESGAIITIANIISFVLAHMQHPGLHVMLDICAPLASIVPTSIVVLSHLQRSPGDRMNETLTVRFATQLEDSAFGTSTAGCTRSNALDYELSVICPSTRSGSSLQFTPDVEKRGSF